MYSDRAPRELAKFHARLNGVFFELPPAAPPPPPMPERRRSADGAAQLPQLPQQPPAEASTPYAWQSAGRVPAGKHLTPQSRETDMPIMRRSSTGAPARGQRAAMGETPIGPNQNTSDTARIVASENA